jgi:DNA helicase-2/ATP-dependent DNA helicase PcrA
MHKSFGKGIVVQVQHEDGDDIITVAFPGNGVKKLLASFAGLEKV